MTVLQVTFLIEAALWLVALGAAIFAFVHAVRQRSDAFTAVDKQTKQLWLVLLGVSLFLLILPLLAGRPGTLTLLTFIAIIATGVYLADVRPKVDEVQRGPRW
ncbi:DUF2516 family protein [Nocardia sp. NPDC127579]|uniref:DUF2516 family protein n=1 Tax=Nocardia sp. NPDC127579 TaxID=3345402 RepID=UPI00363D7712